MDFHLIQSIKSPIRLWLSGRFRRFDCSERTQSDRRPTTGSAVPFESRKSGDSGEMRAPASRSSSGMGFLEDFQPRVESVPSMLQRNYALNFREAPHAFAVSIIFCSDLSSLTRHKKSWFTAEPPAVKLELPVDPNEP
ncbi:hypothetical protein ZIOFF_062921 [Zingiber officinale]|uniref:Uncharacterized protein n=1 Tax=Zingiber officinale TaxID=94328 RepID=A0A8J5K9I5_ZINOF|nr:hypothetical protein ZIOFF_062921 [Zingiber officinale]